MEVNWGEVHPLITLARRKLPDIDLNVDGRRTKVSIRSWYRFVCIVAQLRASREKRLLFLQRLLLIRDATAVLKNHNSVTRVESHWGGIGTFHPGKSFQVIFLYIAKGKHDQVPTRCMFSLLANKFFWGEEEIWRNERVSIARIPWDVVK